MHTGPSSVGYRDVQRYEPGDMLPVPYAETELDVTELLGAAS